MPRQKSNCGDRILKTLTEQGELKFYDLYPHIGWRAETVRVTMRELIRKGKVQKVWRGNAMTPTYRITPEGGKQNDKWPF